jgi:hypothetical protein
VRLENVTFPTPPFSFLFNGDHKKKNTKQDGTTRSVVVMLRLMFYMSYATHLMACIFVLVGRVGSDAGVENWLANELRGPFFSEDTTGKNGGDPVYSM